MPNPELMRAIGDYAKKYRAKKEEVIVPHREAAGRVRKVEAQEKARKIIREEVTPGSVSVAELIDEEVAKQNIPSEGAKEVSLEESSISRDKKELKFKDIEDVMKRENLNSLDNVVLDIVERTSFNDMELDKVINIIAELRSPMLKENNIAQSALVEDDEFRQKINKEMNDFLLNVKAEKEMWSTLKKTYKNKDEESEKNINMETAEGLHSHQQKFYENIGRIADERIKVLSVSKALNKKPREYRPN